jgi:hypothetical protein
MKKIKLLYLILLLDIIAFKSNAQTSSGLLGSAWNYHYEKLGLGTSYIHLGSCIANQDTLINGKTFAVINHNNSEKNEYIRMEGGQALYWFDNKILSLFDFSKNVTDTIMVDLLVNNNTDTIIENVLLRVDSISYTTNITKVDSLKTFYCSILSESISGVFPSVVTPRKLFSGITSYLFATQMPRYSTMRLTELFNPNVNMGMYSKPELTCFTNDSLSFNYKHPVYIENNYSCSYTTGLREQTQLNKIFQLYPNPTNTELTIFTTNSSIKTVKIYNLTGQLVLEQNLLNTPQNQSNIDVSLLKIGLYQCVVELANGSTSAQRLIKE